MPRNPDVKRPLTQNLAYHVNRIYLDHAATTPLDPQVLEAMLPYLVGVFGNPSSVHWYGRQGKTALEQARAALAGAIGADPGEIYFTSGGTESDNFALRGVATQRQARGKKAIVTCATEHHAVLDTVEALAHEGFTPKVVPSNQEGSVRLDQLSEALDEGTAVVSIMHTNNEVGTTSPLEEVVRLSHARGIPVHSDAVQSLGKVPLEVNRLGVDLLTISAHKLYGPKGIGALYVRRGTAIDPLLHGGGQERGKRPGTENVALAVGFARAVEVALSGMAGESSRLRDLRDEFERRFLAQFPMAFINGDRVNRLPHISSISFDPHTVKLEGEMLVPALDLRGIAVSSGSACTSGSIQASHVILAMGRDQASARATLRFSFGRGSSTDDIERVIVALKEVVPGEP